MNSDDDFDGEAYKAFEDQLYGERSSSGLVFFLTIRNHIFFSLINLVQVILIHTCSTPFCEVNCPFKLSEYSFSICRGDSVCLY